MRTVVSDDPLLEQARAVLAAEPDIGPVRLMCRLRSSYRRAEELLAILRPPTCGYEPCDGGPCEKPEAHAAREAGLDEEDES